MAEKKTIKTTAKKSEKKEEVSLEELKRRKEEVLARINAEIGDEDEGQVVIEDKKREAEEEKKEELEEVEKKELEEEILNDKSDDLNEESVEVEKEKKVEETVDESPEIEDKKEEEMSKSHDDELSSTFSAAEFGIADNKGNKGKNIILFLIVFIIVALISTAFYFYFTGAFNVNNPTETAEITPTEAPSPTVTPVELDRAEISIQVLNGSGVSGAAGDMQAFLEDVGYENVEAGNADDSDYLNITIQIKEEFEEFADLISKDISDSYVVNDDIEMLDEDSDYDAVIIVGSQDEVEESDE